MSHRLVPGSIEAQQRTLAMGVVLALPVMIGLWFFVDRSLPPVPGMATQTARFSSRSTASASRPCSRCCRALRQSRTNGW